MRSRTPTHYATVICLCVHSRQLAITCSREGRQIFRPWKYYRFSRALSEAAAPFYQLHMDGQLRNPLDSMRSIAFLSYWIASLKC